MAPDFLTPLADNWFLSPPAQGIQVAHWCGIAHAFTIAFEYAAAFLFG